MYYIRYNCFAVPFKLLLIEQSLSELFFTTCNNKTACPAVTFSRKVLGQFPVPLLSATMTTIILPLQLEWSVGRRVMVGRAFEIKINLAFQQNVIDKII